MHFLDKNTMLNLFISFYQLDHAKATLLTKKQANLMITTTGKQGIIIFFSIFIIINCFYIFKLCEKF